MSMLNDDLPDTPYERALMLENMLLAIATGAQGWRDPIYAQLRQEFMNDPGLKALLPQFVRTCRDLSHFWSYAKKISSHYEPRREHIREKFIPLLEHLEGQNRAPADAVVSDTLASFDADGVHAVWEKALARRRTDPEGAITVARTLLETVCKRVLDEAGPPGYPDDADLPKLYKTAAERLHIAPSQHTEDAFKRIPGAVQVWSRALAPFATKLVTPTARSASRYGQLGNGNIHG
jgi:hypothetical protein